MTRTERGDRDLAWLLSGREQGMRYEIDIRAVRASVATIEEVLAEVRRLGLADDLRPVAVGLPGGRCASGRSQVAAAWQARLATAQWELRELGRCVSLAADGYDAVERVVQQALGTGDDPRRDDPRRSAR